MLKEIPESELQTSSDHLSFLAIVANCAILTDNYGMNRLQKFTIPKKPRSVEIVFGWDKLDNSVGLIIVEDMWWPRNSTEEHFSMVIIQ